MDNLPNWFTDFARKKSIPQDALRLIDMALKDIHTAAVRMKLSQLPGYPGEPQVTIPPDWTIGISVIVLGHALLSVSLEYANGWLRLKAELYSRLLFEALPAGPEQYLCRTQSTAQHLLPPEKMIEALLEAVAIALAPQPDFDRLLNPD